MKATFEAALTAGVMAVFMAACCGEAEAEPVVSSWYGPSFEGSVTASGEVYATDAYTAAHPSLPFGTELLVTYGERQAIVQVTDRGPYVDGRDLDLSQAAAEWIGLDAIGADAVDVQVLDADPALPVPAEPMPVDPVKAEPKKEHHDGDALTAGEADEGEDRGVRHLVLPEDSRFVVREVKLLEPPVANSNTRAKRRRK